MIAGTAGCMMDAPAATAYAVLPRTAHQKLPAYLEARERCNVGCMQVHEIIKQRFSIVT